MGHWLLGLFVPDGIARSGAEEVMGFVTERMEPFRHGHQLPAYRRYLTPEETRELAVLHGVPESDLKRLAEAIAGSEGMLDGYVDHADGDTIVSDVVAVGATRTRIYCVTTEDTGTSYDYYRIGPRPWAGSGSGRRVRFRRRRLPPLQMDPEPSDEEKVGANMAPVEAALVELRETGSPLFTSFLTPEGVWYHCPCYGKPERERSWSLWHLRRFRRGYHVIRIMYHD